MGNDSEEPAAKPTPPEKGPEANSQAELPIKLSAGDWAIAAAAGMAAKDVVKAVIHEVGETVREGQRQATERARIAANAQPPKPPKKGKNGG